MQEGVRVWYFGAAGTENAEEAYLFDSINGNTAQLTHHSGTDYWSLTMPEAQTSPNLDQGPFWIHPQVLQTIASGDNWMGIRIASMNRKTYTYDTFKNNAEFASIPYLLLPIKTLFDLQNQREVVRIVYGIPDPPYYDPVWGTAYFDAETGLCLFNLRRTAYNTTWFILSEINYNFATKQAFAEDNGPHIGFRSIITKTSSVSTYINIKSMVETRYGDTVQMWVETSEGGSTGYVTLLRENYCFFGGVAPVLKRKLMSATPNYPPENWNEYGEYLWWWVPQEALQRASINVFDVPMTRTSAAPYTFDEDIGAGTSLYFPKIIFDNDGYMTDFFVRHSAIGLNIGLGSSSPGVPIHLVGGLSYYKNTMGLAVPPSARPNLTPYHPLGWSDKIVVSKVAGTNTDSSPLATTDTLYVDWAVINDGSATTSSTFHTSLYVDGVQKMSWYFSEPLNPNFYVTLNDYSIGSLSAGTHTIKIVADATGVIAESNETDNEYTKTITILSGSGETNPPTGSITISGGAEATKSTAVTLTLTATDDTPGAIQMCVSNTTTCTAWTAFAGTKSWTLTTGNGTKTVNVWFKDVWGNVNATPYSDTIILDTTAPTNGTVTAAPGNAQVTLNWSGFIDTVSGVASYKVVFATGSAPTSCSTGTAIYSGTNTTYPHTGLTNGTTYYYRVCAIDKAGNMSTGATASAKPGPPPSITVTSPNGGESWTAGSAYQIKWSSTGSPGTYVKIELYKGGVLNRTITSSVLTSTGSYNWTCPSTQASGADYKVKITSTTNSTYTDMSEGTFTIVGPPPPSITVTTPNGGESWTAGTTHPITWTYTGSPGTYVKIELYKGGTPNKTIASSVLTSNKTYNWMIPSTQASGSDYTVKVTSTTNSAYTDTSDSAFTIVGPPAPTITVTSPNGGESWTAGTSHPITWAYTGSPGAYVKIELYKGGTLNKTIAASVLTSTGTYNWTCPSTQASGADYKVKITSTTNSSYTDMSDGTFTIVGPPAPTITVTAPNGGESWTAGTPHPITWTYKGSPGTYVKIELYKSGIFNKTIASSVLTSAGTYNWTIPSTQVQGSDYTIKVTSTTNASYTDMSDGTFTIVGPPPPSITVSAPNGGESWTAGTPHPITWTYTGSPGAYVKIELYKGGVLNKSIAASVLTNNKTYNWSIPSTQVQGSDYTVKITSTTNNSYTDMSDSAFTIVGPPAPTITVTAPNGGESWTAGTPHPITWTYTGSPGTYVKIELYKSGIFNKTIASSVLTSSGLYNWTIPPTQAQGSDYTVKVTSTMNSSYTDISDSAFTIINISGGWNVTANVTSSTCSEFPVGSTVTVPMVVTQTGSNVTINFESDIYNGTISGTSFTTTSIDPDWTAVINGTVSNDGNSMIGTLTQTGDCTFTATMTGSKQTITANIAGIWKGTATTTSSSCPENPVGTVQILNLSISQTGFNINIFGSQPTLSGIIAGNLIDAFGFSSTGYEETNIRGSVSPDGKTITGVFRVDLYSGGCSFSGDYTIAKQ